MRGWTSGPVSGSGQVSPNVSVLVAVFRTDSDPLYRLAVHALPRLIRADRPTPSRAYAPVPQFVRPQVGARGGRVDRALLEEGVERGHVDDTDALRVESDGSRPELCHGRKWDRIGASQDSDFRRRRCVGRQPGAGDDVDADIDGDVDVVFDHGQADPTQYLTITLAQAAVFLIRLTKAPISVQQVINVDPSVVAHYLKMSVDLLESADMSETRLSTYLAKTIRDISRAAGIVVPGISPIDYEDPSAVDSRPHTATSYPHPPALDALLAQGNGSDGANVTEGGTTTMSHTQSNGNGNGEIFDLENFLQVESQLDLGYLLGLPGDNSAAVQGGNGWTFGGNEFEFGLGGLGMGQGMNLDGF